MKDEKVPKRPPTEDELDVMDNILRMVRDEPDTLDQIWEKFPVHLTRHGRQMFQQCYLRLLNHEKKIEANDRGVLMVRDLPTVPSNPEKVLRLSKTVYSWVMPETEQMIREIASSPHEQVLRNRHREAWTSKQDSYHEEFFNTWLDWVEVNVKGPKSFEYRYPTAGSSEAIRETLAQHASLAQYQPYKGVPTIHVFKGEYEGYKALAKPYGIRVVEHDRDKWVQSVKEFTSRESTKGHKWYLSNPSSIDGNFWNNYSVFLNVLQEDTDIKVMLDLCYIGCVPDDHYLIARLDARHDVIDTVFFSLSKVFGVYYHRIGGMFSRTEHPGLWGNKWFKNISSLYLGTQLMKRYHLTELPDKYRTLQEEVVGEIHDLDIKLTSDHIHRLRYIKPSDVVLLAHQKRPSLLPHYDRLPYQPRYCLTQRLYEKCMERGDYEEIQ